MGKRVLVADDHVPMVNLIESALTKEGFSVLSARDGLECLQKVEAERPDLLILDVMMPVMDGLKVLRALRQSPQTRLLPVIMLTVRKEQEDVVGGYMGGADRYLTKPCRIEELVTAVKQMLKPAHEDLPA